MIGKYNKVQLSLTITRDACEKVALYLHELRSSYSVLYQGRQSIRDRGRVPPKFELERTSIALPPKLSEDTRHVGHS